MPITVCKFYSITEKNKVYEMYSIGKPFKYFAQKISFENEYLKSIYSVFLTNSKG
jgi:hypothetical protein